jgi:hypothetical protein
MSGYAATSPVVGATSPTVTRHVIAKRSGGGGDGDCAAADLVPVIVTGPDDDRGAAMFRVAERWTAARQRWSQLTFYLFDPESWR